MQDTKGNLFTRSDTMFGVCEGLGEDFGFNPIFLRLIFAVLLVPFPLQVIGAYLALGLLVAFSRLVFRAPRRAAAAPAGQVTLAAEGKPAVETHEVELAAAA
ncbi:MAG TPA: PspC domain-containing protein [Allosphingosinicella sp.]